MYQVTTFLKLKSNCYVVDGNRFAVYFDNLGHVSRIILIADDVRTDDAGENFIVTGDPTSMVDIYNRPSVSGLIEFPHNKQKTVKKVFDYLAELEDNGISTVDDLLSTID